MRRLTCGRIAVAMALQVATAGAANGADVRDIGPLRIRDQFLLNMGFLAFEPGSSEVLVKRMTQVEVIETVTNTFAHSNDFNDALEARSDRIPVDLAFLRGVPGNVFYLDGEVYRTALSLRRGVGHATQLGVTVQILGFTGGVLDGVIEDFHDAFGLGQHGRLGAPRGEYTVYTRSGGREVFVSSAPGHRLGDLVFSSKTQMNVGPDPWQVSLETDLKLPLGDSDELLSSGHTDVGAQLIASRYYRTACIHGALGISRLGPHDVLGTSSQTVVSGMLGYEQGLGRSLSAVIQFTASESPLRSLELQELAEATLQTSLGVKWRFNLDSTLFLAVTENLAHIDNTADVGFHGGLSWNIH